MSGDGDPVAHRVAALWRIEAPRVIAGLARTVGDVNLAEDLAQDALVAALEQWPTEGVPDRPGAWLTTVARRRWVDGVRREITHEKALEQVGRAQVDVVSPMDDVEVVTTVRDDVLRLVFTACHPVLSPEARVALTLRMVGGLTTDEVARAFLVASPTMGQRISRAKRALADAHVPFEVPVGDALGDRVTSVLEVVYLVFNEGYTATSGEAWTRPVLCEEAMRLGRMVAALLPREAEAQGLVALMELQASRLTARHAPDGTPLTLEQQDRSRWDRTLVQHALGVLERVQGGGSYVLQARIAACHAVAASVDATDWALVASLYGELVELTRSPVVELNRAVAVSRAEGPAAGLEVVDAIAGLPALRSYHLLPAVRADLLTSLGRTAEARAELLRAADLAGNDVERRMLLERAAGLT